MTALKQVGNWASMKVPMLVETMANMTVSLMVASMAAARVEMKVSFEAAMLVESTEFLKADSLVASSVAPKEVGKDVAWAGLWEVSTVGMKVGEWAWSRALRMVVEMVLSKAGPMAAW